MIKHRPKPGRIKRIVALWATLISAFCSATPDFAAASSDQPRSLKIVVQLSDTGAETIELGLKNLKAIQSQASATKTALEIKVVVFGPALKLFQAETVHPLSPAGRKIFEGMRNSGRVQFDACENTLNTFQLKLSNLLPGFLGVPSGAFEVVRLEQAGYQYFRP